MQKTPSTVSISNGGSSSRATSSTRSTDLATPKRAVGTPRREKDILALPSDGPQQQGAQTTTTPSSSRNNGATATSNNTSNSSHNYFSAGTPGRSITATSSTNAAISSSAVSAALKSPKSTSRVLSTNGSMRKENVVPSSSSSSTTTTTTTTTTTSSSSSATASTASSNPRRTNDRIPMNTGGNTSMSGAAVTFATPSTNGGIGGSGSGNQPFVGLSKPPVVIRGGGGGSSSGSGGGGGSSSSTGGGGSSTNNIGNSSGVAAIITGAVLAQGVSSTARNGKNSGSANSNSSNRSNNYDSESITITGSSNKTTSNSIAEMSRLLGAPAPPPLPPSSFITSSSTAAGAARNIPPAAASISNNNTQKEEAAAKPRNGIAMMIMAPSSASSLPVASSIATTPVYVPQERHRPQANIHDDNAFHADENDNEIEVQNDETEDDEWEDEEWDPDAHRRMRNPKSYLRQSTIMRHAAEALGNQVVTTEGVTTTSASVQPSIHSDVSASSQKPNNHQQQVHHHHNTTTTDAFSTFAVPEYADGAADLVVCMPTNENNDISGSQFDDGGNNEGNANSGYNDDFSTNFDDDEIDHHHHHPRQHIESGAAARNGNNMIHEEDANHDDLGGTTEMYDDFTSAAAAAALLPQQNTNNIHSTTPGSTHPASNYDDHLSTNLLVNTLGSFASTSPCGGTVVYGVSSEAVNPSGSATMDVALAAAAEAATRKANGGKSSDSSNAGGSRSNQQQYQQKLARIASVRVRSGQAAASTRFDEDGNCYSSESDDEYENGDNLLVQQQLPSQQQQKSSLAPQQKQYQQQQQQYCMYRDNMDDDDEGQKDNTEEPTSLPAVAAGNRIVTAANGTKIVISSSSTSSSSSVVTASTTNSARSFETDTDISSNNAPPQLLDPVRKAREARRSEKYAKAVAAGIAHYGTTVATASTNSNNTASESEGGGGGRGREGGTDSESGYEASKGGGGAAFGRQQQKQQPFIRNKSVRRIGNENNNNSNANAGSDATNTAGFVGIASAVSVAAAAAVGAAMAVVPSNPAVNVVSSLKALATQLTPPRTPSSALRQRHSSRKTGGREPLAEAVSVPPPDAAIHSPMAPISVDNLVDNSSSPLSDITNVANTGFTNQTVGSSTSVAVAVAVAVAATATSLVPVAGVAAKVVSMKSPQQQSSVKRGKSTRSVHNLLKSPSQQQVAASMVVVDDDDEHETRLAFVDSPIQQQQSALQQDENSSNNHGNGGPPPSLPVPEPLFNLRVRKEKSPYRPSTSLNEDDYDFAIIVRAVVTAKQEIALARAKAQADSMAAAARQLGIAAFGAIAGGTGLLNNTLHATTNTTSTHQQQHAAGGGFLSPINATANKPDSAAKSSFDLLNSSTKSSAVWKGTMNRSLVMNNISSTNHNHHHHHHHHHHSTLSASSSRQKQQLQRQQQQPAASSITHQEQENEHDGDEDEDNEMGLHNNNNNEDPDHDSASDSDSNSGSASEDEDGDAKQGGNDEDDDDDDDAEDEAWYDEWDDEDSDGNKTGAKRAVRKGSKHRQVQDDEDDDDEDEFDEDEDDDRTKGKNRRSKNRRKHRGGQAARGSRSKSASSSVPVGGGNRQSVLGAIVGIAERSIATVRKSLGGRALEEERQVQGVHGEEENKKKKRSKSRENKQNTNHHNNSNAMTPRRVKFGPNGNESEAVITVLPRSPIVAVAGSSSNKQVFMSPNQINAVLSPALFMSPSAAAGGVGGASSSSTPAAVPTGDPAARAHKCAEILASLRAAGLQAKRVRSLSRRTWLIKIKCPEWRLEIEAEKLRLRMRRRDGGWSKFRRNMRHVFVPAISLEDQEEDGALDDDDVNDADDEDDEFVGVAEPTSSSTRRKNNNNNNNNPVDIESGNSHQHHQQMPPKTVRHRFQNSRGTVVSLFHSSDRQTLIDNILRSSTREGGSDLGDGSPLGAYVTHMFPLHMKARLTELRSDWLAIWRPVQSHGDRDRIGVLNEKWYAKPTLIDLGALSSSVLGGRGSSVAATGASGGDNNKNNHSDTGNSKRGVVASIFGWMHSNNNNNSANAPRLEANSSSFSAATSSGKEKEMQKIYGNNPTSSFTYAVGADPNAKKVTLQNLMLGGGNGNGGGDDNNNNNDSTQSSSSSCDPLINCLARNTFLRWFCNSLLIRIIYTFFILIAKCGRSTGRLWSRLMVQPLDRIAAYFGETIAFYFAWLEFYTQWLVFPSLVGILLFLGQLYYGAVDIAYAPLFSLTMALWSILFLECWKRRNAELAQRWGVLHYEDEEAVRPQFAGKWKQDAETGEIMRVYPRWKRALKYAFTVPVVCSWVLALVMFMIFVYSVRDHMLAQYELHELVDRTREAVMANATLAAAVVAGDLKLPTEINVDLQRSVLDAWNGGIWGFLRGDALATASALRATGYDADLQGLLGLADPSTATDASSSSSSTSTGFSLDLNQLAHVDLERFGRYFETKGDWKWWIVMVLPPVFLGLLMPIADFAFGKIALRLNSWENHTTESQYRNHRIAKVFFFRFTVSFISLFYYAFSPQHSIVQLTVQLAAFLVVGQVWNNVLEVVLPSCLRRCREFKFRRRLQHAEDSGLTEGRRGRRLIRHAQAQAWVESRMPRYDSFNDYAEMLIQFGYVTFFSWAFPLAPAFALLNNLIEMRTDAFKLCYNTQRPIAHKAGGIGVWYNVLVAMSLLAVLTNCAHLALVSKQFAVYFPGLTESQKMLVVFVFEHLVLSLRLVMPFLVPPTPGKVKRRIQRDNFALAKLQGRRSLGGGHQL